MMMNEEADPDDLQAVFAHEYEDVYDFQVRRRQHPFTYLLLTSRTSTRTSTTFTSGGDVNTLFLTYLQCCGSMTFWGGSGSGSDPQIHASD